MEALYHCPDHDNMKHKFKIQLSRVAASSRIVIAVPFKHRTALKPLKEVNRPRRRLQPVKSHADKPPATRVGLHHRSYHHCQCHYHHCHLMIHANFRHRHCHASCMQLALAVFKVPSICKQHVFLRTFVIREYQRWL